MLIRRPMDAGRRYQLAKRSGFGVAIRDGVAATDTWDEPSACLPGAIRQPFNVVVLATKRLCASADNLRIGASGS